MSVKCRVIGQGIKNKKYEPGDIIFAPWLRANGLLCPNFLKHNRDPILICLPENRLFSPDLCDAESKTGWDVTSELECITVSPTVMVGNLCYWIKDGFIYEEEEYRKLPTRTVLQE